MTSKEKGQVKKGQEKGQEKAKVIQSEQSEVEQLKKQLAEMQAKNEELEAERVEVERVEAEKKRTEALKKSFLEIKEFAHAALFNSFAHNSPAKRQANRAMFECPFYASCKELAEEYGISDHKGLGTPRGMAMRDNKIVQATMPYLVDSKIVDWQKVITACDNQPPFDLEKERKAAFSYHNLPSWKDVDLSQTEKVWEKVIG